MKNRPGYTKGGDTLEEGIDGSFSTPSDPWILNSNRCCRGNLRSKGANLPFDTLSTLPIHKGNLSLSLSFSSLFLLSFLFSNSEIRGPVRTQRQEEERRVIERWNHRFRLTRCFSLAILDISTLFAVKSSSRVINRMGHAAKLTRAHYPPR